MAEKTEDLKSPGGSYTATPTFAIGDKTGAEYNTSMSAQGGAFGINVWRVPKGKPAELIITKPGCHGTLMVIHRKLWFYWNTADKPLGKQKRTLIEGYIHETDAVSGTIVDINDSQLAGLRQQLKTAQDQVAAAHQSAANAEGKIGAVLTEVAKLKERVTALEKSGGSQPVNEAKIAEIVWAKIWDVLYVTRMGMNAGSSTDANIQGWITDLTNFVKRVK